MSKNQKSWGVFALDQDWKCCSCREDLLVREHATELMKGLGWSSGHPTSKNLGPANDSCFVKGIISWVGLMTLQVPSNWSYGPQSLQHWHPKTAWGEKPQCEKMLSDDCDYLRRLFRGKQCTCRGRSFADRHSSQTAARQSSSEASPQNWMPSRSFDARESQMSLAGTGFHPQSRHIRRTQFLHCEILHCSHTHWGRHWS